MHQFKLNDPDFLPHTGCDIEFSIASGEVIVLVGENGIGKTTLARRFYEAHPESFGFVEQGPSDYFYDRKVRTLKELLLASRDSNISQEILELCWSQFGLEIKEDRYQSELSGGEGQALKLSLGLPVKKEFFILDEPTQYLDSSAKKKLGELVSHLVLQGKSFLIIEHDLTWLNRPLRIVELGQDERQLRIRKSWTT